MNNILYLCFEKEKLIYTGDNLDHWISLQGSNRILLGLAKFHTKEQVDFNLTLKSEYKESIEEQTIKLLTNNLFKEQEHE